MGEKNAAARAVRGSPDLCEKPATTEVRRRPKGSGSVSKLAGVYRARLPGSARTLVAEEETYEAAAAKLDAMLEVLGAAPSSDASISLFAWIQRCLVWRESEGLRNTKNEVWKMRRHVERDPIGAVPLIVLEADPARLRAWLVRLRLKSTGGGGRGAWRPLSGRTITNVLAFVRDAFERAVRLEVIATNPMRDVRLPRAARRPATTVEEYPGVLEPDEQTALILAAEGEPTFFRAMLFVALWTAVRKTELLQLRWEDVFLDCAAPYMMIRYGGRGQGCTKSGKPRKVPLYGWALALLREWRAEVLAELAPAARLPRGKRAPVSPARLRRAEALSRFADLDVRERRELRNVADEVQRALACEPPEKCGVQKKDNAPLPVDADAVTVEGGIVRDLARAEGIGGKVMGHGLVFPGPRGERIKAPLAAFRRCLRRAQIARTIRWHDLRHTCATSLLEGWRGPAWTAEAVRQLCGHSDVRTTEKYLHARGHLVFAMAKDADRFFRDALRT